MEGTLAGGPRVHSLLRAPADSGICPRVSQTPLGSARPEPPRRLAALPVT